MNTETRTQLAIKTTHSGDYGIEYEIEAPHGFYEFSAGKLEWKEPQEENAHICVVVKDAQSGDPLPGLTIDTTLLDRRGGRAASATLTYLWDTVHPHYGANVKVPPEDGYLLQIHVFPPTFSRFDKERGKRFAGGADVQFEGIAIT